MSCLVILSYPELKVLYSIIERVHLSVPCEARCGIYICKYIFLTLTNSTAPYSDVPGYLAFREAPHLLHLIRRLREERPDLEPDITLVVRAKELCIHVLALHFANVYTGIIRESSSVLILRTHSREPL